MCGRLKTPEELQEIRLELKITDFLCDKYKCRYNVPPTLPGLFQERVRQGHFEAIIARVKLG